MPHENKLRVMAFSTASVCESAHSDGRMRDVPQCQGLLAGLSVRTQCTSQCMHVDAFKLLVTVR